MKQFKNIGKTLSRNELKNITGGIIGGSGGGLGDIIIISPGYGTGTCSGSCSGMGPFGMQYGQCKVPTNPLPGANCYCSSPFGSNQCPSTY